MRKISATLAIAFVACGCLAQQPPPAPPIPSWRNDAFIGFERRASDPTNTPGETWYHQNALLIQGNAISIYKSPVLCRGGKLYHSESDGGFYSYEGTISGGTATLEFVDCDYCGVPRDRSSPFFRHTLPISFPSSDTVRLGDTVYRKGIPPDSHSCPPG
jgi:hypothetical protein